MAARLFEAREERRQFEVHHAKAPVGLPVGYVAHIRVVMPHAELFQLGEQFRPARLVQLFHAGAAVGGDDGELFRVGFEQARHKAAAARLQMAQDAHFVLEALPPSVARAWPVSEASLVSASLALSILGASAATSDCQPERKLPVPKTDPLTSSPANDEVRPCIDAPCRGAPGAPTERLSNAGDEAPLAAISIPVARVMAGNKAEDVPKEGEKG